MKVNAWQQPWKLAEKMERAGVLHDSEVRADLVGVHLERLRPSSGVAAFINFRPCLHFCHMTEFRVRETLAQGNSDEIAEDVRLHKRIVRALRGKPIHRPLMIEGAIVSNNGQIMIRADEKTRIYEMEEEPIAV